MLGVLGATFIGCVGFPDAIVGVIQNWQKCAVGVTGPPEASPITKLFQIEPQQATVDRDHRASGVARPR
jgi:Na+-translocating ferredoxin:NAD+ oxidoreductase RNF subunit RnfB